MRKPLRLLRHLAFGLERSKPTSAAPTLRQAQGERNVERTVPFLFPTPFPFGLTPFPFGLS